MIVLDSNASSIEGEVISISGFCENPEGKKLHCSRIEDIESQVIKINMADVKFIDVLEHKLQKPKELPKPKSKGEKIAVTIGGIVLLVAICPGCAVLLALVLGP